MIEKPYDVEDRLILFAADVVREFDFPIKHMHQNIMRNNLSVPPEVLL
ncbi:hypothetical protein [Nonlabens sp. MB-3u-79]|nr:hypothetical protein [Nonlabens sp. MB-3u-79]